MSNIKADIYVLTRHALDHHGDGHSRGEPVRVEDDVRVEAGLCPGQVLDRPLPAADALLAGARRELVADGRVARDPGRRLNKSVKKSPKMA